MKGGHSDAFDWDRHLAHVSNIYDMLLPYILSGGRLSEDHLGIRESGNGIPDIIDEARNMERPIHKVSPTPVKIGV